ncbi:Undecaprenyl-phosphate mannosyltransferase [Paenibacillus plantiphilus]|uniref:Undecaprenyl-phosphate mannosyltransferase n=1 Tax=Paenibacillus plantiphilus TaxID=2905650 RepID=A0ABN8FVZ0_9BACL|nr:glycosyltransferase family 2 protein [Paenibacillus plantiphilus]CAH1193487.1 Undecaprenyl-phosphate mannosyltransferase [Paenibacillus plantiphilus]
MNKEILIIIPAYNEAVGIRRVIADIQEAIPYADILVVNDGSSDNTGALAKLEGALVANLSCNLGIGGAVQTGYRYAAARGYNFAAQMDGDGQHNPADFARMLEAARMKNADMVVGSRFVEKQGFQSTAIRKVGIRLLSGLLTGLLGRKVTDPTSGYRICNRRAITLFACEYPTDYPEVEALVLLDNFRYSFLEVPVVMNERSSGTSSITSLKSVYYMVKVILAVLITRTKKRKWRMGYEN